MLCFKGDSGVFFSTTNTFYLKNTSKSILWFVVLKKNYIKAYIQ